MGSTRNAKKNPAGRWFALAAVVCMGHALPAASQEVDARIRHKPVETAWSGVRIELAASIRDAEGVDVARVYFKAEGGANFLFVPMRAAGGNGYAAILPAPSAGVGAIEYRILARNLAGMVYKTQAYAVAVEDGDAAVASDSDPVEVFTELAELPDTVHGFTDNIALDVVESAAKYGVVAGLTGEAGAGTAAASVSATGGSTVAASAGLSTVATVGVGAAAAVAVGGVVVAIQEDENRAPEFPAGTLSLDVEEGTEGDIGAPVTATDPDGDALTYSLGGADAGLFEIDAASGQLGVGASTVLDFEARTSYAFEVVASDGELTATRSVDLSVSDVNEMPAFPDGDVALSVEEGTQGDIGHPVTATDPDGDALTYSLGGAAAGLFEIDAASGQLGVGASTVLDFEARTSYAFEVVASDGELTATRSVDLSVSDVNEMPAFPDGDVALSVEEGATGPIGDPVTATDPDGDALTYSLGGAAAGLFEIDAASGQLGVGASTVLDFEARTSYAFEVVASDGELTATRSVDLSVSDVNEMPAFPDGDVALSVEEGTQGDIGHPVTATDPDGDALTYSLGGADAGLFEIDAASGQLGVGASTVLDFEARTSYAFEVVASDGELTATRSVDLSVSDVNEMPAFPDGDVALSVEEGTQGDIGHPVTATDPDGDALTYSLGGAAAGLFEIDAASGQLGVGASTVLDFEARTSYAFEVVASDGELTATRSVDLSVSDVNEMPAFPDGDVALSVEEGATGPIGDPVTATDPDGDALTYSLGGAAAGLFEIDAASGQLGVGASTVLDFEARTSYAFEVVASDGELTATRSVDLSVSDVNETPAFPDGDMALSVEEGTQGDIGHPVTATDPDGDALTYSLGGADAGLFEIDAASGQVSVSASTMLDFEARTSYAFEVIASDPGGLEARRLIVVTISDTNEAPVFPEGDLALDVEENTTGAIGEPVTATDPDGDSLTYDLEGDDRASFEIDAASGQLSVPASVVLDVREYRFVAVAADPGGLEARRAVVVSVAEQPKPTIGRFVAEPAEITEGDETRLSWEIDGPVVAVGLSGLLGIREDSDELPDWQRIRILIDPGDSPEEAGISGTWNEGSLMVKPEYAAVTYELIAFNEAGGASEVALAAVTVVDTNEPPTFPDGDLTLSVSENTTGPIGDPVTATDPDGDSLTYSLSGADAGLFEIDAAGQLSARDGLDVGTYTFDVVATDPGGLAASRAITVKVLLAVSESDWRALVALYNSTDGANWTRNDNWSPSLDTVPTVAELDSWLGVTVSNGRVTHLSLFDNNLTGSIPPELGRLTNLQDLYLVFNRLTGPIPRELGGLTNLEQLNLNQNRLTGPIPPELGGLTNLEYLGLGDNDLTGSIPPELGGLTNLERLNLGWNRLGGHPTWEHVGGPIPPELGGLSNLVVLWLEGNYLPGPVPPALGGLTNLEQLNLAQNRLTGRIPTDFTELTALNRFFWHHQRMADPKTWVCAPTDAAFQGWLKTVHEREGPNCADTGSSVAGVSAPRVEAVSIVSDPGPDGVYGAGEVVETAVRFDRPVTVAGVPQLRLGVGSATVPADLVPAQGGEWTTLSFRYAVAMGDHDADGVSVGVDALRLNGGSIAGADGSAAAGLGGHAIENAEGHIVDARVQRAERAILEDALAAQGRAHLASATGVIGDRFRAGPASNLRLKDMRGDSGLRGRYDSIDAEALAVGSRGSPFEGVAAPGGVVMSGEYGTAQPFQLTGAGPGRGMGSASLSSVFGRNFAIPLGGEDESPGSGWTLWGANAVQTFRGTTGNGSYDGDLRSLYLGIDGRIGDDWLAGVALSRSRGETAYGFEVDDLDGEGSLRANLTSIHPYLHGRLSSGLEVWGIAGFGGGEAVLQRDDSVPEEAADLAMGLGALGVRQGLREFGSLKLSLLADAGVARLATDAGAGERTMDGLSALVTRFRVGIEGEHFMTLAGGGSLRPFWQASGRYDGGDGLTGAGMELAAGVRYGSDRWDADIQARWLAVHSSASHEEFGASASLRIKPNASGLGLTAALSPQWGASGGGAKSMWREEILRASREPNGRRRRQDSWSMDGRLEYGVALPHTLGVLSPFGEFRLAGETSVRQRLGLRLDRSMGDRSLFGAEFGAAVVEHPLGRGTTGAIDLTVEARF